MHQLSPLNSLRFKSLKFLIIAFGLLAISACSKSTPPPEPEAQEIKSKNLPKIDGSETDLFVASKELYRAGLYSVARESFEALRDNYPMGAYGEFAHIKIADGEYESGDYPSAAVLYDEFLKRFPASEAAPYVLLKLARSYEFSNKGSGRDLAPLTKALDKYQDLLTRFPKSYYASLAQKLKQEVLDKIAAQEDLIIKFYKKTGKSKAAEAREQEFVERWGADKKASLQQTQVEAAESQIEPSETVSSPLVSQSLDSPELQIARRIERQVRRVGGASPSSKSQSTAVDISEALPLEADVPSRYRVQNIDCKAAGILYVFLDKEFTDESELAESIEYDSEAGTTTLKFPEARARSNDYSCGDFGLLHLEADGSIKYQSAAPLTIMPLNNPPRVLLRLVK